jgi:hypothetical protein
MWCHIEKKRSHVLLRQLVEERIERRRILGPYRPQQC